MDNHDPLNGIEMGDIGPKFGYNSKDNGYLRFTNFRIPRTNMLSKFAELDKEGKFIKKGDLRILYAVMMAIRTKILLVSGVTLANGLQISGRYACVRRQFASPSNPSEERRLIDY